MKFAILTFPGSGSDVDLYHAIHEVLGQKAEYVRHTETDLSQFDAVLIPSGASYGDYLRPGALAQSAPIVDSLKEFATSGKPVLGVGNGFQILTEAGLLPGAFLQNKGLKFRSGNTKLTVRNANTMFTSEYEQEQAISMPFAHEYGNYFVDEQTITELKNNDRIVFTYANDNEDGSIEAIAGVINEQGNVLGMMPLPDRAVEEIIGGIDGLPLFNSIVKRWSEKNVSQA